MDSLDTDGTEGSYFYFFWFGRRALLLKIFHFISPVIHGADYEVSDLQALSASANVTGAKDPESKRSAGVVLIIFIKYSNLGTFDLSNFEYTYSVDFVENTEFKTEQAIYDRARTQRSA